ncbi:MAG: aspartate aminotransferase family protein [Rhodobacteraceae bacterium]|nr:aspartate aminotransferase family protein [Paracoccaceae bacterium]
MDNQQFREWSRKAADWGAEYRRTLAARPVRSQVAPGDIARHIAPSPPEQSEGMEEIFEDFERFIVPGMTHCQHPNFFAYFPANAAPVSVVAEYLVTAMAAQCMLWQTSPAATELEIATIDWLRQAFGLADGFSGSIQDSASSATLVAVLTMRERALEWRGNQKGLAGGPRVRIYASGQNHTSIDRAIWVSGIGQENLVHIPVKGDSRGMDVMALEQAIKDDIRAGYLPAGIIGCVGSTGVGASDDIVAISAISKEYNLYLHVDAAWAGSAMICPEFRHYWEGVDQADSVVVNPHKWLGAQFDCTAHFIRQPEETVKTLAIEPEYLKTHGKDNLINFSEWSVPLGRRFRALKLWFLLRAHGLEGLRAMIRNHVKWSGELCERIRQAADFEIITEPMLSLFTFRHAPAGIDDLDQHNLDLVGRINEDGRIYVTQTRIDNKTVIRFQVGQFETMRENVMGAFEVIAAFARSGN